MALRSNTVKQVLAIAAILLATTASAPPDRALITSVWMSQDQVRPGDVVRGVVHTTKNTASIEVRVGGYGMSLTKVDMTTFVGGFRIPHVPFFFKHRWTVRVIARTINGVVTDERDTELSIH